MTAVCCFTVGVKDTAAVQLTTLFKNKRCSVYSKKYGTHIYIETCIYVCTNGRTEHEDLTNLEVSIQIYPFCVVFTETC